jgi:hypothetical protein
VEQEQVEILAADIERLVHLGDRRVDVFCMESRRPRLSSSDV